MDRRWEIYTLSDPRTMMVRYVGVTVQGILTRLKDHLKKSVRERNTYCARWINSLVKEGLSPIVSVLELGYGETRKVRERYWISTLRQSCDLTNLTDGGDGTLGYSVRPETREKIRRSLTGRHLSDERREKMRGYVPTAETRAKLSLAARGRKVSESTKALLRLANKGRTISEDHKERMRIGRRKLRGRPLSPERKAKLVASLYGRKMSPEHKARLLALNLGKKASPEARAKMSAARKGKKFSPEHRARMSEAGRRRWAKWREEHACA